MHCQESPVPTGLLWAVLSLLQSQELRPLQEGPLDSPHTHTPGGGLLGPQKKAEWPDQDKEVLVEPRRRTPRWGVGRTQPGS